MARRAQYLQLHGGSYRVRLTVPPRLHEIVGRKVLYRPLQTESLTEAEDRKWAAIADLKKVLSLAERALISDHPLDREALRLRIHISQSQRWVDVGEGEPILVNDEADWAVDRAHEIEAKYGEAAAHRFADMAFGRKTPLDEHVEASCRDRDLEPKTRGDLERALGWLNAWQVGSESASGLEAVDRRTAGDFLRGQLSVGRGPRKIKSYLSALRSYWRWMLDNGYLEGDNPWDGLKAPRSKAVERSQTVQRPFTQVELVHLLSNPAPGDLAFLMRVAALSGMRIAEIMSLKLADCRGGHFTISAGKTVNARRSFPIHPGLLPEIERRLNSGQDDKLLVASNANDRPKTMSQHFTRFRRSLGIGAGEGTSRDRSEVDFHSFRRWFIREARNALTAGSQGFDAWTFSGVIGHADDDRPKSLDLAQLGYAGEDGMEAKRALVLSVQLPANVPALAEVNTASSLSRVSRSAHGN